MEDSNINLTTNDGKEKMKEEEKRSERTMELFVVLSRLEREKYTASKSEEAMEVETSRTSVKRSRDSSAKSPKAR